MEQISLFSEPQEKGSAEWHAFNTIEDRQPGMYRVETPIKQQPRYGTVVPIRRYKTPHRLFPKPVHSS